MKTTTTVLSLTRALILGAAGASLFVSGCATTSPGGEERVRVVRNEEKAAETGGIAPDKQAEIQLLLQQRNPSTLKCYNDVLAEKHDRAFKGHVAVLISLEAGGRASDVQIVNSSLNNKDVHDCLIAKIKDFEFPQIEHAGSMQYVYHFEPAY
ncbi:MAG: AgmX/PglI C-terminal domain-containing protein [Deltaproteobacteria bacterium]|nr:AgmX/PglI C-terminal domain-containing protein [Deltaproteobacteria bacterium]